MFIITDKDNIIIHYSETLEYNDDKDIMVDMGTLTLSKNIVGGVYDIEEPIDTEEKAIGKYCYTKEDGFYKNPNFSIHYGEEERIAALEEAVNSLLGF